MRRIAHSAKTASWELVNLRIAVCGSMDALEKIWEIKSELSKKGHEVIIPKFMEEHRAINSAEANKIRKAPDFIENHKHKYIRKHFDEIEKSDAVLVVNAEKRGIKNYIGGATFAEIMLAFHYNKKIFFLNPIPTDSRLEPYLDELRAVKPVIVNGNLSLVK